MPRGKKRKVIKKRLVLTEEVQNVDAKKMIETNRSIIATSQKILEELKLKKLMLQSELEGKDYALLKVLETIKGLRKELKEVEARIQECLATL